MKKSYSLIALAMMGMALASCGNDDPDPTTVYAQSPMLNHVYDKATDEVCLSQNTYSIAINDTKAMVMASVKLDGENMLELSLSDLAAQYSQSGGAYIITSSSPLNYGGYDITGFRFRLDMTYGDYKKHHARFDVNDQYVVNCLQPTIQIPYCQTNYTSEEHSGGDTQGSYKLGFDIENMMADITMLEVFNDAGNNYNLLFAGLKLEATKAGFHIGMPDDKEQVQATERNELLVACDLNFDMSTGTLSGTYRFTKGDKQNYDCEVVGELF